MASDAAPTSTAAKDERGHEDGQAPEGAWVMDWRRIRRPFFVITAYYGVFALLAVLALAFVPRAIEFAPVGGAGSFGIAVRDLAFEPVNLDAAVEFSPVATVKLILSIAASFALMIPVTWVCMGTRRRRDLSQSFVHTILVLPLVITGIVHVVHDSLALAFSLAGIVAGVRFRHTLKESADTTYLFTAIGVGVACGINAVEVAAIISIFFNYAILGLWATEFGERATGQSMFAHNWMTRKEHGRAKPPRVEDADAETALVASDPPEGDGPPRSP